MIYDCDMTTLINHKSKIKNRKLKMSHFRFVYVVFCCTAVLIVAVYLRSVNNRLYYKLCVCNAERDRLKQDLGAKQLRLESLINPASLSQRLGQKK
jgi:hypothetical protein